MRQMGRHRVYTATLTGFDSLMTHQSSTTKACAVSEQPTNWTSFTQAIFMAVTSVAVFVFGSAYFPEPINDIINRGWFWMGLITFLLVFRIRVMQFHSLRDYLGGFIATIICWPWIAGLMIMVKLGYREIPK